MLFRSFYHGKVFHKLIDQNPFTESDTMKYFYQQGLLSSVEIHPENQIVLEKLKLEYDNLKNVTNIIWLKLIDNVWITNRKMVFTYDQYKNIKTYKNYYYNGTSISLFDETYYEGYDNKINPKTNFFIFGLLNDHFVYLPYVKLQINNPIKETLLRGTNTFVTNHSYLYSDTLPIQDNKIINIIPNTGVPYNFSGTEFYEYD